jgi:hypothetical protein
LAPSPRRSSWAPTRRGLRGGREVATARHESDAEHEHRRDTQESEHEVHPTETPCAGAAMQAIDEVAEWIETCVSTLASRGVDAAP